MNFDLNFYFIFFILAVLSFFVLLLRYFFLKENKKKNDIFLKVSSDLAVANEKINNLKNIESELNQIKIEKNKLEKEIIHLRTSAVSDKEKHNFLLQANETLENRFKILANKIFEEKGKAFSDKNSEQINNILRPLKESMVESFVEFKNKVEKLHVKDSQERSVLSHQVRELKESNLKMNDEARKLTTALKHEFKTQGNWGELILENLLERSGLQLNKDYILQVSFKTENGRKQPDAIINLPEKRHIVIDSKVSLNSYLRLVNSQNEVERIKALKDLSMAINSRIKELADRSYYELPGLKTPEVVLMFIPNESAFIEVHKQDEFLTQTALDNNVLLTCPTTLLASLRIVRQIWRFEEQNANTKELIDRAGRIYKKFIGFLDNMEKIGNQIDSTKNTYLDACNQLKTGKGNLINQAKQLEKLAVVGRSKLPQQFTSEEEEFLSTQKISNSSKK